MSLLEVRNLRVRFETARGPVQAVDSVSFDLEAGETLALVGESGCGKSATALALLSLLPRANAVVETGEALLVGRNLLTLSERELQPIRGREVGFVFQDPTSSLHPLMSIGAQLEEVLRVHERVSRAQARARAADALAEVGLPDPLQRLRSYPHELSGGMRQRVGIAMALLCRPKLLIADEPTTALDATVQAQILELLRDLQRRHGTAVLLITHDFGVVASAADRVHVMYAGSIVETGTTAEIFERAVHPYTLGLLRSIPSLSVPPDADLPSIPGAPPDATRPSAGCAFQPRCTYATEACAVSRPPLVPPPRSAAKSAGAAPPTLVRPGRRVACFEAERVDARESRL